MAKNATPTKRTPESDAPEKPKAPELKPGDKCPMCDGQGKVDNIDKRPWVRFDPEHNKRVRFGEALPMICPGRCKGTGIIQP